MNRLLPFFLFLFLLSPSLQAQWVQWMDASSEWLSLPMDSEEKDIAVGDMNNDGFQDIIVSRKNPFSNPGGQADLLLINTGASLEDMTATYAPEFLTNLSDARDVLIFDLDSDGWLDVVFCNTFEDPPIFFHNKGNDVNGDWLGLEDESEERFPLPLNLFPLQFCAVWAGDVTGDGSPDLYFSNYNPGGPCDDLLLVNDGNGYFTDESEARLGILRKSAFGTSAEIHDMDNDGDQDIIKISTLFGTPPWNSNGVFLLFNDGTGHFSNWQKIPSSAPYMFTVADFNRDGKKDVYVVDDGQDYYQYTDVITPDMALTFNTVNATDPRSTGFGGNVKLADLDNDGDLDLGLADVDVDIPPCESGAGSLRKFTMSRNDGSLFTAPYGATNNPWNQSTFDFAFIDLNNDCYVDIFAGRCSEYFVYINEGNTPTDLLPAFVEPEVLCPGDTYEIEAPYGYVAYEWSNGETTRTIEVTGSGQYCLTITNEIGCTETECVTVTFEDIVSPLIDIPVSYCEGDTALLDAGPNFASYFWTTGQTSQSIEVSEAGLYGLTVTTNNECLATFSIELNFFPNYDTSLTESLCEGEVLTYAGVDITETGTYTFNLESVNGCDSVITLEVQFFDLPEITNATILPQTTQGNGSISLEIAGGAAPYTIEWSNGASGVFIEDLPFGDYTATVTDANGCQTVQTYNVPFVMATGEPFPQSGILTITPNPFTGDAWFDVNPTVEATAGECRIYTITGQLLAVRPLNGQPFRYGADLAPGAYWAIILADGAPLDRVMFIRQ